MLQRESNGKQTWLNGAPAAIIIIFPAVGREYYTNIISQQGYIQDGVEKTMEMRTIVAKKADSPEFKHTLITGILASLICICYVSYV